MVLWPSDDDGHAGTVTRCALCPVELDRCPLVVEDRAELQLLSGGQLALHLDNQVVVRQPDLELDLLRPQLLRREFPRCARGLDALLDRFYLERGVGDLTGDPELDPSSSASFCRRSSRARS